jgi:hypothetical protein
LALGITVIGAVGCTEGGFHVVDGVAYGVPLQGGAADDDPEGSRDDVASGALDGSDHAGAPALVSVHPLTLNAAIDTSAGTAVRLGIDRSRCDISCQTEVLGVRMRRIASIKPGIR